MSNKEILHRILDILSAYERGEVSATYISESVDLYEPSLEKFSKPQRDKLHALSLKILEQDTSDYEKQLLGLNGNKTACKDLKTHLDALIKSS